MSRMCIPPCNQSVQSSSASQHRPELACCGCLVAAWGEWGRWWAGDQALEFVGDALLDFLVTEHIYRQYPLQTPRQLTFRRASLVNNENMARIAVGAPLLLHRFLRHTSHTLAQHVLAFVKEGQKLREAAGGAAPEAHHEAAYFGQGAIEAPKARAPALASSLPLRCLSPLSTRQERRARTYSPAIVGTAGMGAWAAGRGRALEGLGW